MTRGKSLIVLLSLYSLVLSNAGYGAESPAELAKQAERLDYRTPAQARKDACVGVEIAA